MKSILVAFVLLLCHRAYGESSVQALDQEIFAVHHSTWQYRNLNEGYDKKDTRGVAYNMHATHHFLFQQSEISLVPKPYHTVTAVTKSNDAHYHDLHWDPLLETSSISYVMDTRWSTQFRWSHVVFSKNSNDANMFAVLLSYHPGW